MIIQSAKEWIVYKKAYELSMRIFRISKNFPHEERFALTGQIRRSSRSVCMNLPEAWAKRQYVSQFISKLTDCDAEINQTDTSVDFARDCEHISHDEHQVLIIQCKEIGKLLGSMIQNPKPFLKMGRIP